MLDEIESKTVHKDKEGDLQREKPVKNVGQNLQSFLEISPVQKEVLSSHKLRTMHIGNRNPFKSKKDIPSQRNCQTQLSHPGLFHIYRARMSGESLIQGKIHNQQNSNEGC